MFRSARYLISPAMALVVTVGTLTAVAQTKSSSKSSSSKSKVEARYRRLPSFYGKLKLSDEQKEEIYSIKSRFGPEIDELEAKLDELREEQADEIKDVLTRTQVTALNKLIDGSESTKKSSSSKSKKTSSSSSKK